jgi:RNA recognition motif-containing protein
MKLYIGNLPKSVTEQQLGEVLAPFGKPATVEIAKDSSGASKGFAFAEFANDEQARATITGLDGKEVSGQKVKVNEARPRRSDTPKQSAPQA